LDWTDLDQDWEQWRALRNTIMHLQFPENIEKFLSSWADRRLLMKDSALWTEGTISEIFSLARPWI
jgi:hypothetical protein